MELNTRHFGTIEIDEGGIINFPEGIPGFIETKKFVVMGTPGPDHPFMWLQGVDNTELAFVVIDPFVIKPDYYIDVDDEDVEDLGIEDTNNIMTLAIVVIPEDIKNISANLRAPILINTENKTGKQITLNNESFPVKYYVMKEVNSK